jgi:hypothetical protein
MISPLHVPRLLAKDLHPVEENSLLVLLVLGRQCSDLYYYDFYVGQSNNLQRRLLEHLSSLESTCIQRAISQACGFQYALVEHPTHRDAAEAAIYHQTPNRYFCNNPQGLPALDPRYLVEVSF